VRSKVAAGKREDLDSRKPEVGCLLPAGSHSSGPLCNALTVGQAPLVVEWLELFLPSPRTGLGFSSAESAWWWQRWWWVVWWCGVFCTSLAGWLARSKLCCAVKCERQYLVGWSMDCPASSPPAIGLIISSWWFATKRELLELLLPEGDGAWRRLDIPDRR
jgi:hypothetical protein